jgi:hypothetical protein
MVVIAIVTALVFAGLLSLSRRRTKLALECGEIVFSGMLRTKRLIDDHAVDKVVDVEVTWGSASSRRSHLWLLVDKTGHTLVSLNRYAWDHAQLENLRQRVDLPIKVIDGPRAPRELRYAYPRSVPWWGAYPLVAVAGVIVAVATVITIVQVSLP